MKSPKAPKKPLKPIPPNKTVNKSYSVDLWDCDGDRLSFVIENRFPDIPLTELFINTDYRGYDGGTVQLVRRWEAPNPKYGSEMTKYHSQLEKYEEARRQYKLDVEEYKQKLKVWHEEQLKGLTE